jgi:SAM-dependent methyltransferase
MAEIELGREHFQRIDTTDDALFYQSPRLVTHIDAPACRALGAYYRATLPAGGDIIDLMSSCVSHFPDDVLYGSVTGLGMNTVELDANERLTRNLVHDLNRTPALPFEDASFDACTIAVSVQYLVQPIAVFAEIARVSRPGAPCIVSFSNRMFPTKAVAVWCAAGDHDHARLVGQYFIEAGGFGAPELNDLSPDPGNSDPLYVVVARHAGAQGAPPA